MHPPLADHEPPFTTSELELFGYQCGDVHAALEALEVVVPGPGENALVVVVGVCLVDAHTVRCADKSLGLNFPSPETRVSGVTVGHLEDVILLHLVCSKQAEGVSLERCDHICRFELLAQLRAFILEAVEALAPGVFVLSVRVVDAVAELVLLLLVLQL